MRKRVILPLLFLVGAIALTPLKVQGEFLRPVSDWCSQQNLLTDAQRHTVQVLLEVAGTQNCPTAAQVLSEITELDLSDRQLTDLAPLTALTQLQVLYLGHNQIDNISPLRYLINLNLLYLQDNEITSIDAVASLQKLRILYLDNNRIQNLNAVADLSSLQILYANNNKIENIESLAGLLSLTELYLANNQIQYTQALAGLAQLEYLNLGNNRVEDIEPLRSLVNLAELDLSDNQITQLDSLKTLKRLQVLDVRNNPLHRKNCPVFPATICVISDAAAELFQTGENQFDRGEFTAALSVFQQARQVYKENGDRLRESDALDRMGNTYDELGQYANSLALYQEAAAIRQRVGDRQGESETLTNLGITYIRLGQTEKAIASLQESLAIHEALAPVDRSWVRPEPREGRILSALALAYERLQQYDKALRYAQLSLASYRRGRDQPGEAVALNRIGTAYLNLGDLDKAFLYLDKALKLSEEVGDRTGMAHSMKAQGDWRRQRGDTAAALALYQEALTLRADMGDVAGQGEVLNAMGELFYERGDPQAAVATLTTAIEQWEALRPGLTDENKISIAETQAHTYRLLQQVLIEKGDIEAGLEIAERGRARAFTELLAHRLTLQGKSLPTKAVNAIPAPPIDDIKRLAQEQSLALVEYSLVEEDIYIWVVTPAGAVHFRRQSLEGKPLRNWVRENRVALGVPARGGLGAEVISPERQRTVAAQGNLDRLHQLLIDPIADLLPTGPREPIVIIPQGELYLVPFPALTDAAGQDLIDNHALLFAPAISLFLADHPPKAVMQVGHVPAVVVGNPIMPTDPATGSPLPPLSGAEQEARNVASILNTAPLIGAAATTSAVVADMEQATIIHLATHGLLDDFGTGVPGALAFTPTANDDGFLTAAEILELPWAAQLVVLSACNTGRGNITGDGVVGLSRSLLTAGVDTVMVSLWSVPDEATAVLMEDFYQQLKVNANEAIALRAAMMATRDRYPNPFNWAAFSLYGRINRG